MVGLTLDTSGAVYMPKPTPNTMMPGRMEWPDLSPFAQGYAEAMFASLRSSDPEAAKAYQEMRRADLKAGNRPLLCDCRTCLYTTAHWSRTHQWPGICDQMRALGVANIVASVADGKITEPTDLGRRVYTLLVRFSDLAPETLAAILKDCEDPKDGARGGALFWTMRERGEFGPNFPPLIPYLGDDGRVLLREGVR